MKSKIRIKKTHYVTVCFEKIEGGYSWVAFVRLQNTGKLVKVKSGIYFENFRSAKDDFYRKSIFLTRLASNAVLPKPNK